jgi:hypothetical protein
MPAPLRRPLAVVAVLAAAVVVMLGVLHFGESEPGSFDRWVWPSMEIVQTPWHAPALVIDFAGEPLGATSPGSVSLLRWLSRSVVDAERARSDRLPVCTVGSVR